MNTIVFPYGIQFHEGGKMMLFPAAEARIMSKHNAEPLHSVFLIDSGATVSVLPAGDADVLGIELHKGKRTIVRCLGATDFFGFRHIVTCKFQNYTFKLPVIFVDNPATLRIFGREGLFEKFIVLFDESKHRTIFLSPKERKHINALLE